MPFYDDCIREAAEKGIIPKSYINTLRTGFSANYDSEPFLSIKEKISRGECVESIDGYPDDIELSIIKALVADKKISKAASRRFIDLLNNKKIEVFSTYRFYQPPTQAEKDEWNRAQEEKKITQERENLLKNSENVVSIQCPYCKSSNVVRPSVAADQGSSSHLGVGVGSGGVGLGLGSSKTIEAKKALNIQSKEFKENVGSDESNAEKVGYSVHVLTMFLLFYLEFWVIGYNWEGYGDSVFISVFVLLLYIAVPLILPAFLGMYVAESLADKGGKWLYIRKRSVTYWMCRSCGQTFKK